MLPAPPGTLRSMNTHPLTTRRRPFAAAFLVVGFAAGGIALAFAETPVPDPPVPDEGPFVVAAADGIPSTDCGCATPQGHDLQSQVDRHLEQWQALHDASAGTAKPRLHPKSLIEGVVGFPVRHYRLAADDQADATR